MTALSTLYKYFFSTFEIYIFSREKNVRSKWESQIILNLNHQIEFIGT